MTSLQFQQLLTNPEFLSREHPEGPRPPQVEVIETHISYVILTHRYAYKIKKTARLPFLDFSTLALRQHYCEQELQLNRRLAPAMYRDVLPVKRHKQRIFLGAGSGETFDYALKMQRMDTRLEMDRMLQRNEVTEYHVTGLAHRIACFHGAATVVHPNYTTDDYQRLFRPLAEVTNSLRQARHRTIVRNAIAVADRFVEAHAVLLRRREREGLIRDVHGDLHCKNIFLTDPPTVFDCLEFDATYRQIDLLDEVAFLCMDLEAYGAEVLSRFFYREYLAQTAANGLDQVGHDALFTYFKLYRANVRAKVGTLQAKETPASDDGQQVERYLKLLDRYTKELSESKPWLSG